MEHRIGLVVTTINSGDFLEGYFAKAKEEGVADRLRMYVIPDLKTPASLYEKCETLKKQGFWIECPTVEAQDQYLGKFGQMLPLVPKNSDNRRNIGYLRAFEDGCEFVVSIDDDNFCNEKGPVFKEFSCVATEPKSHLEHDSSNGWINMCESLVLNPAREVYPRGFPYAKKFAAKTIKSQQKIVPVHLNAGLWLEHPDLDGITWLNAPVRATAFDGKSYVLSKNTWSPVNTQNTSLVRAAVPSYYFVKMGYPLAGMPIDRYGDIFSGYFCQACVKAVGAAVRVGTPIAIHRRNSHNYMRDAQHEMACILVLEDLLAWLPECKLPSTSYVDAYLGLASAIEDGVQGFKGSIWTDATRGYFHQMAYCMRQWIKTCQMIGV